MIRPDGLDAAAQQSSATASTRERRLRVLYVENNLSNLTLMQRILAMHRDIELIPAMQGGVALELARSHRPALVLLDLNLPDISGEEVLKQLRLASDCEAIPVVVLTGDATPESADRLLKLGAHACVAKPLQVKAFIQLLDAVLDLHKVVAA